MKQLTWLFCILYAGIAHGQTPLKPGDRLPDLPMEKVLYQDKIISLNSGDYKNKLLIIDLWSTSCSYCVETFPKLDELQNTYADKVKVISATYHTAEEVRKFKSINKLIRYRPTSRNRGYSRITVWVKR